MVIVLKIASTQAVIDVRPAVSITNASEKVFCWICVRQTLDSLGNVSSRDLHSAGVVYAVENHLSVGRSMAEQMDLCSNMENK